MRPLESTGETPVPPKISHDMSFRMHGRGDVGVPKGQGAPLYEPKFVL
jgi:hypothetical protein